MIWFFESDSFSNELAEILASNFFNVVSFFSAISKSAKLRLCWQLSAVPPNILLITDFPPDSLIFRCAKHWRCSKATTLSMSRRGNSISLLPTRTTMYYTMARGSSAKFLSSEFTDIILSLLSSSSIAEMSGNI